VLIGRPAGFIWYKMLEFVTLGKPSCESPYSSSFQCDIYIYTIHSDSLSHHHPHILKGQHLIVPKIRAWFFSCHSHSFLLFPSLIW
jgi:hypothetical protein